MAAGTNLILEFADAASNSVFFFFPFADDEASTSSIKNAMNTIIANGSIFLNPPVSIKSAKAVITSETEFDLSE